MILIEGLGNTKASVIPMPARKPVAAADKTVPAGNAIAPAVISDPLGLTLLPTVNWASPIVNRSLLVVTFSCITTVSAPSGSGAPVVV